MTSNSNKIQTNAPSSRIIFESDKKKHIFDIKMLSQVYFVLKNIDNTTADAEIIRFNKLLNAIETNSLLDIIKKILNKKSVQKVLYS